MEHPLAPPDLPEIGRQLRRIVGELTGLDLAEVDDDVALLDYVTSSLMLVEGMRRVFDQFGVLVSIREVIESQASLSMLALYIDQALRVPSRAARRAHDRPARPTEPRDRFELPLAPAQRHVGFLARYSPGASAAYNEALLVRLEGPLHGLALQAAVEAVGQRYQALRTALSPERDALEIDAGERVELIASHCSAERLRGRLADLVGRPFEVGERLFRAELLRLSESDYLLALVGHALVLEPEALAIVLHEIAERYRAAARGQEAEASPPALQWTEYLARGESERDDRARAAAETFWKATFSEEIPQLELPADRPRPPVKSYAGARLLLPIEPELEARLRAWAEAERTTPFAVLFGAFSVLLHRLAGQRNIVLGVGREPLWLSPGQRAVARTRDMVPVRSGYDPGVSFADHVRAEAVSLAEAYAYGHLSLAELIQALDLPRDQSRSAIFSAAFRAESPGPPLAFDGLRTTFVDGPGPGARYDLELTYTTTPSGARLRCDYSSELFHAGTIERWLGGLIELVRAGIAQQAESAGLLPIMAAEEQYTLLDGWNATEQPYAQRTVLDLIVEQARARPGPVAIRCQDGQLTYAQLAQRVEAIAGRLHAQGVRPGDRVGLLLPRSPDLIPSMLAVWRVGAILLPLDPSFPDQRLAFILADAAAQVVITSRPSLARAEALSGAITLALEALDRQDSSAPGSQAPLAERPASAYILYTSGSTGQPKGIEIGHAGLTNCLLACRELLGFTAADSFLAITTVSFDISLLELLLPLVVGGVVELAEDGLSGDGIRLAERLAERKPSFVQATPSTWKAVLAAGWGGDRGLTILSGGEALSRELAEHLLLRSRTLWNLYGPTEATIWSTACRVTSAPNEPIRIGRPFPNTRLYILDEQLQPVPIGVVGELYIGGDGLALGYWRRPELTDEQFVANPFRAGERLYRSGDLARYEASGDVIYLGRIDDQVKVHGVRIELGEVEAALRGLPGLDDAVVTTWRDAQGDSQLVAHIIASKGGRPAAAELRAWLRQRLPEAMIPPYIIFAGAFPLTASGKVHRAALPAPEPGRRLVRAEAASPATPTERLLAEAWSRVLGVPLEAIRRDDNFLDLGGHSLLMTPLMLEVRTLFNVTFSLREFFGAATIRTFAALIDERRHARSAGPDRGAAWARQRMLFLQREAQLPPSLAPARGLTYQLRTGPPSVLLTGATGFLGAYLVAEVLGTTDAELYCLVRPRRGESAQARIEGQLRKYEVWREDEAWAAAWERRLHVVEGDVTLPRLGIADPLYEPLAESVDRVIHSAAHVNFIYPYEALRATNVLGVHEIIRFAFHRRIKPVHYLSTAAIWPMGGERTFYESDSIEHGELLNLGYDEAKWVGERCLLHAADRGLPLARYRPGEVGGDSRTGRCVLEHFILAAIKGFLQFGALPVLDMSLDVTPVDYVARALVHVAFARDPLGRAFHLTNPRRCHLSEALSFLRSLGYRFEELPFEQIRDSLVERDDFASNALFPYQAMLAELDERSLQLPTYDCRQIQRELDGSGIVCPPVGEELFTTYMRYLRGIGFMPEPEAPAVGIGSRPLRVGAKQRG